MHNVVGKPILFHLPGSTLANLNLKLWDVNSVGSCGFPRGYGSKLCIGYSLGGWVSWLSRFFDLLDPVRLSSFV